MREEFLLLPATIFALILLIFGVAMPSAIASNDSDKIYAQALELARQGAHQDALQMLEPFVQKPSEYPDITQDYIAILTWAGHPDDAIRMYKNLPPSIEPRAFLQRNIAKAYMDQSQYTKALHLYSAALKKEPRDQMSIHGMAIAHFRMRDPAKAFSLLKNLKSAASKQLYANLLIQNGQYWDAIQKLNPAIKNKPNDSESILLRIQAYAKMGSLSIAEKQAREFLPGNHPIRQQLRNDRAVQQIKWAEPEAALSDMIANDPNRLSPRERMDHIAALVEAKQYLHAIEIFEQQDSTHAPDWFRMIIAKAYLGNHQPDQSLPIYSDIATKNPENYAAQMGKFYSFQEAGRWKEAEAIMMQLKEEQPWVFGTKEKRQANPKRSELAVAETWLLADQDRLAEAEDVMDDAIRLASGNEWFRDTRAYIYLFRGWPRKAQGEFRTSINLKPSSVSPHLGLLNIRRTIGQDLHSLQIDTENLGQDFPNNIYVEKFKKELSVSLSPSIYLEAKGSFSDDNASEHSQMAEYSWSSSFSTRYHMFLLHRQAAQQAESNRFFRFGAGIHHIFNQMWQARASISAGNLGADFGGRGELEFTPDDFWTVSIFYDTYVTDLALRARVFDIDAKQAGLNLNMFFNESNEISLGASRAKFSDSNIRKEYQAQASHRWWRKGDIGLRGAIEAYRSSNSSRNAPYFNPESDWSLGLTHTLSHDMYRRYEKRYTQKLSFSLGNYFQSNFGSGLMSSLAYRNEYNFSPLHYAEWQIGWNIHPYDGQQVQSWSYQLAYVGRF